MAWRKIVVNDKTYRWTGSGNVVIQNAEGKRVSPPFLPAAEIKGITYDQYERGQHKRTTDGMLTPRDISTYIKQHNL